METKKNKTIVVGLSGGVDSSVAAYILKEQGYNVVGLFMKNWHDTSVTISKECPWLEDSNDAMMVAQALDIPFSVVDLSEIYRQKVVDYMFSEYEKGRTPNPDVLCNREIKFDVFLRAAMELGADYVATGHYARVEEIEKDGKKIYRLLAGLDGNKDQSYFLCQLSQEQLSHAMFPIGEMIKPNVRKIAAKARLITAEKKDSQGICFVGKVKLPEFLKQKLTPKDGDIVEIPRDSYVYSQRAKDEANTTDIDEKLKVMSEKYHYSPQDGKVIGTHHGAHFFTCGQRKGLDVGGHVEPIFVIDTDTVTNTVYVGEGKNHSGLYRKALFINAAQEHWVREDESLSVGQSMDVMVRIRYRQPLEKAVMHKKEEGIYIEFDRPQSAVTSGQFAAAYTGDELIFSGVID
ncbi:MAG: tRNA 2-thiouridine(34) synthase MnmA [Flavobacteriales bacterium]|nr:tRNA 2-thiouridine(34) synthase MnmA [Flavobacteriales bacterium]